MLKPEVLRAPSLSAWELCYVESIQQTCNDKVWEADLCLMLPHPLKAVRPASTHRQWIWYRKRVSKAGWRGASPKPCLGMFLMTRFYISLKLMIAWGRAVHSSQDSTEGTLLFPGVVTVHERWLFCSLGLSVAPFPGPGSRGLVGGLGLVYLSFCRDNINSSSKTRQQLRGSWLWSLGP